MESIALRLTRFTALKPARLSKRFTLAGDTLVKESGGNLQDGIAERLTVPDLAAFAAILPTLTPKQALGYGINGHDRARVIPKDAQASGGDLPIISRTREHFAWPQGPGIMMLDYDPAPDAPPLEVDALRAALAAVCPALAAAPAVWRPSASSCIYRGDTLLRGIAGQRLYIPVTDAADIPRAGAVLFDRLWLAGLGRYELSKAGAWLARSVIDNSVFQPERLDFAGGAAAGRGLQQRLPDPLLFHETAPYLDTRAALPDLDASERQRLAEVREALKAPLKDRQCEIREQWIEARVQAGLAHLPEADRESARPRLEQTYRNAAEGARLTADFELTVIKKGTQARKTVTVGALLRARAEYHEATTLDPLEPDYPDGQSRLVGWLNLRAREPYLQSHAHGGARYFLGDAPDIKRETSIFDCNKGNRVTDLNDKGKNCYPNEKNWVTKVTNPKPYYFMIHLDGQKEGGIGLADEVEDENGEVRAPGLWFVGVRQVPTPDGAMESHHVEPTWVSIPFEVLATADDGRGHGYSIAIRFRALHGQTHTWPIPRALLVTDGHEILNQLYAMGFKAMDKPAKANDHLRSYLNRARPQRQALSVSKTGWAGSRFVLPDQVIGNDSDGVFYQTDDPRPSPYTVAGSLDGWRDHVAKVIEPYDVPVFSISCAFAAPLLSLFEIQSGGFHCTGTSTTGKTSAQNWALSVWGKPRDLRHTWHGTRVGFELTAAAHSDALLMLDEIGQADPREVGDLIYMIFNEAGRMRGNARLTHRSLPKWQLLLLSSGEKSLQDLMQEASKTPMAGQELRLVQVPVDSGDGCGILDGLADSGARGALIRAVDDAVSRNHGHPIRVFLSQLTKTLAHTSDARVQVNALAYRFTEGITSDEVKRAALRFALAGFAGELASQWAVTGWPAGRAAQAAEVLFRRWLSQWGYAARHDETVFLDHLEVWLSGHQTGHFAEVDPVTLELTPNAERALTTMRPFFGFTTSRETGREFYLNAAGWTALTRGFSRTLAIETLRAANRLEKDPRSGKGKVIRVGDRSKTGRYYVIRDAANAD